MIKSLRKLGIMQGRLSPPVNNRMQAFPGNNWKKEFYFCKKLGLNCIEWIYDTLPNNPFCSDDGIKEMMEFSKTYDVQINSLLTDYFMEIKLFGENKAEVDKAIEMLYFVITQCHKCNIPIIEIPLVDSSALKTENNKKEFFENLQDPLEYAKRYNIDISLETSLPPKEFREYILSFKPFNIKVNYDMGNSAALGYNPTEEIELLGEFIVNVHIKDRVKGGGTVPLGTGDTDFQSVFNALNHCNYTKDFILQGARQDLSGYKEKKEAVETIKNYINFIKPLLEGN